MDLSVFLSCVCWQDEVKTAPCIPAARPRKTKSPMSAPRRCWTWGFCCVLLHDAVSAHLRRHLTDAVKGERRLAKRFHGNGHTPFVSKHCRAGRPALALTIAWQKNVCQERSAKSQPVCILCRTGCRTVKLCILKFYLISRCIFCKKSQSLYSSYSSPSSAAMNWGTALGSMPRMYANSLCSRFCASCKARSSKAESPLPWALRAW